MAIQECQYIWRNGELIPWAEATTHVLSHALHYGTAVFEGIRVYDTPDGPMGFRLREHMKRMQDSARIYQMKFDWSVDQLVDACRDVVGANGLESAYIRPIAFYGYGSIGVTPAADTPVELVIAAFPWGAYLGEDGKTNGVDVCLSSWNRVAPNTIPAAAKAAGNYLSGYLVGMEAHNRGFHEGIALGANGLLSEGAGENVFVVQGERILTPPSSSSIMLGITRDSVLKLAADNGLEVLERDIPRELLYIADEVFLTGTAAEITPVRSVDGIALKAGSPGPVTRRISDAFFGLFDGRSADIHGWLEPMRVGAIQTRTSAANDHAAAEGGTSHAALAG